MNDEESAESIEESNFFSVFYFLSYGHFCLFVSLIFNEFFIMTQKVKNWVKTDGGGVCISLFGKKPKDDHISKAKNLKIDMNTFEKKNIVHENIQSAKDFFFVDILSVRHFVCRHFVC